MDPNETKEELLRSLQSVPPLKRLSYETTKTLVIQGENNTVIDHIPSELFSLFPKLTRLMSFLQITEICDNDLVNSTELNDLYLSKSKKLHKLSTGNFAVQRPKLIRLSLIANELATIDDFTFANLAALKVLSISENKLTKINRNTFAGLFELMILHLSENKIHAIENDAFVDLKKLDLLSLSGNKLKTFDVQVFNGPSKLGRLYLGDNPIESVGAFLYNLTSIYELDLEGCNSIADLDLIKITNLPFLIRLNLGGTGFSLDQYNVSDEYSDSSLQELDLSNNNLTNAESFEVLRMFRDLWRLDITGNHQLSEKRSRIQEILYPKLSVLEFD